MVAGALFAGGIAVGIEWHGGSGAPRARTIDMARATAVSCLPPGRGARGGGLELSQEFRVRDSKRTDYLLGWQVAPYRASKHTYHFARAGNLLALEPATGGRPLGFATGTLTIGGTFDAGSVDATVQLKQGGSVAVTGNWICPGG